jgi:hypothetical protein
MTFLKQKFGQWRKIGTTPECGVTLRYRAAMVAKQGAATAARRARMKSRDKVSRHREPGGAVAVERMQIGGVSAT